MPTAVTLNSAGYCSSLPISVCNDRISHLELAAVGVLTPQKAASATNYDSNILFC